MKIIRYILTALSLFTEFMTPWYRVVVCGDYPKYGRPAKILRDFLYLKPLATRRSLVRHGIHRPFKYASDFIWWLGKNNLSCLMAFADNARGKRRKTEHPMTFESCVIGCFDKVI